MMTSFQMQMIAQGYLVYDLTSEAKKLSFVSAASGLPMLVFSLIGGAIADKVNKKVMIFGNGGSASIASHFTVDLMKMAKKRCVNWEVLPLIYTILGDKCWGQYSRACSRLPPKIYPPP